MDYESILIITALLIAGAWLGFILAGIRHNYLMAKAFRRTDKG